MTIDDPTRFYVREVPTHEMLSWRWRIYVPPGEHMFHVGSGRIPATGIGAGSSSGHYSRTRKKGSAAPIDPMQGEYTLSARVERDQVGNWRFVLSYRDRVTTMSIPKPDAGWLAKRDRPSEIAASRKYRADVAGSKPTKGPTMERQTESFAPDEPVVLLRLRAPEDLQTDTGEPCDGVMIWFDKPRFPLPKAPVPRAKGGNPGTRSVQRNTD